MKRSIILVSLALTAQTALASGFEKSIPWGGQTSGAAGIGSPYMQGSQALYFNPAGLASDRVGMDVTLNLSPTNAKFKAPITTADAQGSSAKVLVPYALTFGHTINDKIGWGIGTYISGGTYADFTDLTSAGTAGSFESKTDLTIAEYAAGIGYKVMDGLKLGIAYRVVTVSGGFSTLAPVGGTTIAQVELKDLKDTNYTGVKIGAQYQLGQKTDLGFTYRGETNFKAKGTRAQTVHTAGSVLATTSESVTATTTLPAAWTLGLRHQCTDMWKFLGEYVFTQYSKVNNLGVDTGNYTTGKPLVLAWKDQTNVRLAAEYTGFMLPIRFGYIWTSQVSDNGHSFPSLTPPGMGHTLTAGTGYSMGAWRADGGLEYTMVSGTKDGATSKSEISEYALHLGGAFMF